MHLDAATQVDSLGENDFVNLAARAHGAFRLDQRQRLRFELGQVPRRDSDTRRAIRNDAGSYAVTGYVICGYKVGEREGKSARAGNYRRGFLQFPSPGFLQVTLF